MAPIDKYLKPLNVFFALIFTALVMEAAIFYLFETGLGIVSRNSPLIDAALEIKLKVTTGHLWFEEIVSGDRHEDLSADVFENWRLADWYAGAMLEGGETGDLAYMPIKDPELRKRIRELRMGLARFVRIAEQRLEWYSAGTPAGSGTDIDQNFDVAYNSVIASADAVERMLHKEIGRDTMRFRKTGYFLFFMSVLLPLASGFVIFRFFRMREENRRQLAKNEAMLRAIFRSAPAGIGVVVDRVFVWANEKIRDMTGYDAAFLEGKSARVLYPDDREYEAAGERKYEAIRKSGMGTVETRWLCKDGRIIDVLLSSSPIDPEDFSKGVTFTALDITHRKKVEAEKEQLIRELEEKNAELERFTYTVSHDLKGPLVTIKGYLGMLEKDALSQNEDLIHEDVEEIRFAADKMARLLDELLELSRIGRIDNPRCPVSMDILVEEAVKLLGEKIRASGVAVEVAAHLPTLLGDEPRLLEVFLNLIENAIKYMGDQKSPKISIEAENNGDQVTFRVRDNGIGIEPRYQDRIFKLFEQLDQSVPGTGIGLAIARRIVEHHKGRIWVESEGRGHGSAFCVALPCAADPEQETGEEAEMPR